MTNPDTFDQWLTANAQPGWTAPTAEPQFTATAHRDPSGRVRLALTLANKAVRAPRDRGFLAEVPSTTPGSKPQSRRRPRQHGLPHRRHRLPHHPGGLRHGRFCCLDEEASDPAAGRLVTTAFPVFRQAVYESRPDLEPAFTDLARDPVPILRRIAEHMQDFLGQWDAYLDGRPAACRRAPWNNAARIAAAFADEHARFIRGIDLIDADLSSPDPGGLGVAFCWMNQAMRRLDAPGGVYTPAGPPKVRQWRLFQIVFIVVHLAALAAREPSGSQLQGELDYADILWFPTGGGKSAALYGITAVAMFYDRLRGKKFGTTSIIRFPLRMLSVQQLDRILRLVVCCELVRSAHHGQPRDSSGRGPGLGPGRTVRTGVLRRPR